MGQVVQEGNLKGRDGALHKEDIINGTGGAGGQFKREGWCIRRTS